MPTHKKINHLAAVITCHNYSDFLAETLPENLPAFDDVVVVTGFNDKRTQEVCRSHNVQCVTTDLFTRNEQPFNKAAGINLGLARLTAKDAILQLDADIALPPDCRAQMEKDYIDRQCIYGADRVHVSGYQRWDKHRAERHRQHTGFYFLETPPDMALGARIIHNEWGYIPIGYFQLWFLESQKRYPQNTPTAERTDMTFAMQFAEQHRRKFNSLIVYHLDSDSNAPKSANWNGRKTPPFRPHHKPHHNGKVSTDAHGY